MPVLTPDTDPETVLLDSEDIIWRWCVAVEDALHPTPDGLPPKELVDSRFRDLKRRFAERMLGMTPEAHQTGESEPKLEEQESATDTDADDTASPAAEDRAQRRERRWQMCIDKGLKMPTDTYSHYPRGVGQVAVALGITRQALTQDLDAYRERLFGK